MGETKLKGRLVFDTETSGIFSAARIIAFDSASRSGKSSLETVISNLYRLNNPKFVKLAYRKGQCFIYALALAFHLSWKDAFAIVESVCETPRSGATIEEVEECIRYAEAIYERRVTKIAWRGRLFNFCKEYYQGLFLVNCSGHIAVVFNGAMFGSKYKNYPVYGCWQIALPIKPKFDNRMLDALRYLSKAVIEKRTKPAWGIDYGTDLTDR